MASSVLALAAVWGGALGTTRFERNVGQAPEHGAHTLAPLLAEGGEVSVAGLEAAADADLEAIALEGHEIDRHADREVAAHGRVERDQHALHRVAQVGRARDDPIDDRLAVLRLTRLEEG